MYNTSPPLILCLLCVEQEGSPFIVCMTYAFQTPEKLCFILDLMNGGDLHYHLSQHGVFTEKEVRFYAAEVMLGLEHMHSRFVVYRDLKVRLADDAFLRFLLCQQFRLLYLHPYPHAPTPYTVVAVEGIICCTGSKPC